MTEPCDKCEHVLHAINGGPCGVIVSDVLGEVRYCHCILPLKDEWLPGSACEVCGSYNTGWNAEDGGWCGDCGSCDSDE